MNKSTLTYREECEQLRTELAEAQERIKELEEILKEQRESIVALNTALGGEGSLTTDNLVRVGRLEQRIKELEAEVKASSKDAFLVAACFVRDNIAFKLSENSPHREMAHKVALDLRKMAG